MVKKTRILDVMARYHGEIEKSDEVAKTPYQDRAGGCTHF